MLKVGLWLGVPALVTFAVSAPSVRLENTVLVFAVTLVAMLVGIGPHINGKVGR